MSASAPGRIDGPRGWLAAVVAMTCLIGGPSTLLVAGFGVFVEPLSQAYGWSRGQIGATVSFLALAIMVASPLQGILIDRFGARRAILGSIPLLALGLAGLSVLPRSLPLFYAYWFLLPLLAMGVWPASYLKIVSGWFDRHLGLATGVTNAGIGIGTIIVPPLLAIAIAQGGLRAGFFVAAALALITLPLAALALRESDAAKAAEAAVAPPPYRTVFADPTYRRISIAFLLFGVTGTGMIINLVSILVSKGFAPRQAVVALSGFGVAALFGRLFSGALLDRYHAKAVATLLAGTSLAALVLLSFPIPPWAAVVSVLALGLLSGGEFDVLAYTLRRYFGLAGFGRRYGAAFSMFQLGAAIGGAILAASVTRYGNYSAGLLAFAAALLCGTILFRGLGPYPNQQQFK